MIDTILDVLSWVLILGGAGFSVVGAIGLLRFPDFYTRLHAAGITDTLGAWMLLVGFMLQAESWQVVVKLIFIVIFLFFTSPTATHALARAALASGLKPWARDKEKQTP
ncbi:MAG: monovalent cation/H(+) antiporter subunit G [Proteobacteria bacterium]|nr:monovalent cation/H(+) antiporter subunit G [Pseudomonadota bacterium]MDA1059500.1 monovalent cation/H(+) antiporter subunit G [Pseudomonadota bacterium]